MSDNTWGRGPRVDGGPGEDGPLDLSALRPGPAGSAGWEALAARIDAAAAPELARRARPRTSGDEGGLVLDLVPALARALRPALAAAAVAAVVVGAGLARGGSSTQAADAGSDELSAEQLMSAAKVAQALRVDDAEAAWIVRGAAPSRAALAQAVGLADADDASNAQAGARP